MMSPLPRLALAFFLVLAAPAAQQARIGPRSAVATLDVLDVGQLDAVLIRPRPEQHRGG
jgi:hypothetical protein